jgi:hypothetical protein
MVWSCRIGCRTMRLWTLGLDAMQPGRALHSLEPDLVDTARALRAAGKDGQAIATLKEAAVLEPESVRAQVHLSNGYQAVGPRLLAEHDLSFALGHPECPAMQRHQRVLYEVRNVIRTKLGTLEGNGEPVGAEVWLNGQRMGTLPLKEPLRAVVKTGVRPCPSA